MHSYQVRLNVYVVGNMYENVVMKIFSLLHTLSRHGYQTKMESICLQRNRSFMETEPKTVRWMAANTKE